MPKSPRSHVRTCSPKRFYSCRLSNSDKASGARPRIDQQMGQLLQQRSGTQMPMSPRVRVRTCSPKHLYSCLLSSRDMAAGAHPRIGQRGGQLLQQRSGIQRSKCPRSHGRSCNPNRGGQLLQQHFDIQTPKNPPVHVRTCSPKRFYSCPLSSRDMTAGARPRIEQQGGHLTCSPKHFYSGPLSSRDKVFGGRPRIEQREWQPLQQHPGTQMPKIPRSHVRTCNPNLFYSFLPSSSGKVSDARLGSE
ncbi:hypothetical protein EDD16DRAFT_1594972 [Pisolithus croceorrhizus]|nr:hypothetical protein EDD16DRAFT_1594972 [Pisolithus croceorrhizus]